MSDQPKAHWSEENSRDFIDYGDLFIPFRTLQADMVCQLLSQLPSLTGVLDLCCGAGYWARRILGSFPTCKVWGYDASAAMLTHAHMHCQPFGDRFEGARIELEAGTWRKGIPPVQAVISSLAIHHLDGAGKQQLFSDLYQALPTGGCLLIADLVQPVHPAGFELAARQWDDWVKDQAQLSGRQEALRLFTEDRWNYFRYPDEDPIDQPDNLSDQLGWMQAAGFSSAEVYWMYAGHALFGGWKSGH